MIYTSYWAKLKHIPKEIIPINISLYPPKGDWKNIKDFMPTKEEFNNFKINHSLEILFDKIYQRLQKIDIKDMRFPIEILYQDIVLLCYEKDPNLCHRFIISKWLNENNIKCEEWK